MQRSKFWCQPCDLVFKSQGAASCPGCGQEMRNMGTKWRVGKKGHREDWHYQPQVWWWTWLSNSVTVFEMKLDGRLKWDKKRGDWVKSR